MPGVKVSIVIPVYNMERYLAECLESVVNQTLKEIEILCIDDGSTDGSGEILDEYAQKYPNVLVIHQMNCGVGEARNKGIKQAAGEFVSFIDPDDFYPNDDVLEVLYNSAITNNVLICGGSAVKFSNGNIVEYPRGREEVFNQDQLLTYENYQFPYGFWRFIYQLDLLRNNQIFFPNYIRFQDPPFMEKAIIAAGVIYVMKKVTYVYRQVYKIIYFTPKRARDMMNGFLDLIGYSRQFQLSKLQKDLLEEIRESYLLLIYKHIVDGEETIIKLWKDFENKIDKRLLEMNQSEMQEEFTFNRDCIHDIIRRADKNKKDFFDMLNQTKEVLIYGAGYTASIVAKYIRKRGDIGIRCFLISSDSSSLSSMQGIPIQGINQEITFGKESLILVAASKRNQLEIKENLKNKGFFNFITITLQEIQLYGLTCEEI